MTYGKIVHKHRTRKASTKPPTQAIGAVWAVEEHRPTHGEIE